jgi:hypothetical protein
MRERAVSENDANATSNFRGLPQINDKSMTSEDRPPADITADLFPYGDSAASVPELPYAATAQFAHAPLCDIETLLDLLRSRPDHVKSLLRPPFGRFRELDERPGPVPNKEFRDPRVPRDSRHDMRMPPYLRDSDFNPLSLTYRQYQTLKNFMTLLQKLPNVAGRPDSPIARRTVEVAERLEKIAPEVKEWEREVSNGRKQEVSNGGTQHSKSKAVE